MIKTSLKLLTLGGAFGYAVGCTLPTDAGVEADGAETVASDQQALYIKTSTLWKPRSIPVCFTLDVGETIQPLGLLPVEGGTATERSWIRSAAAIWGASDAGAIEFTGWGTCTSTGSGKQIEIVFYDGRPNTDGLGTDEGWRMTLNRRFKSWGGWDNDGNGVADCRESEAARKSCMQSIAAHEFGHALGFAHEHKRPDTPAEYHGFCGDEQGTEGEWMFGAWDEDSIMNYCNGKWNNDGALSANDKKGVRAAYGKKEYFPRRWTTDYGSDHGWVSNDFPRMVEDIDGDGAPDIVGFGNRGFYVSRQWAPGLLTSPFLELANFGHDDGWGEEHPRVLADVDGDGRKDVVGFANVGTRVSLNQSVAGNVVFEPMETWSTFFGRSDGWTLADHPRFVIDMNNDGRADIVGFANDGVYVALSTGSGFGALRRWSTNWTTATGWTGTKHVRIVADVTGDGRPDIIGFANDGTYFAKNLINSFGPQQQLFPSMGYDDGWRVGTHPRMLADVDGDGDLDIVGFSNSGPMVAVNDGSGRFTLGARPWIFRYGGNSGWGAQHPRLLADVNGDGAADVVGFGNDGLFVSLSTGMAFGAQDFRLREYGHLEDGWDAERHPRVMADMNGDGRADVVGFASDGVHISLQ